ncbi:phospholipase/Carboxylesterase [Apiospora kogelbergensis]|uniref:Phospholipase/Carboxylesterase n=1 Tax=Apiospora kogelbergensis TaxID=1337665 RepID=A0AAW0QK99_9PEZI
MSLESKVVGPTGPHTHTVIFLHGRDSGCAEFADEFFESETSPGEGPDQTPDTLSELFPTVKWVFPSAPVLRSARFDGAEMSQWFDMWSVEDPEERPETQRDGLQRSVGQILSLIRQEGDDGQFAAGVPRSRIFLCGISQGFATAVAALLAEGQGGFAGMIGLCSWMPSATRAEVSFGEDDNNTTPSLSQLRTVFTMTPSSNTANEQMGGAVKVDSLRQIPILITHSLDDNVVPVGNGRRLRDILRLHGFTVEWKEYPDGGHWINEPQGVDDMVHFLRKYMDLC